MERMYVCIVLIKIYSTLLFLVYKCMYIYVSAFAYVFTLGCHIIRSAHVCMYVCMYIY